METRAKSTSTRKARKNAKPAVKNLKRRSYQKLTINPVYAAIGLLVGAVFICYANSLGNGFVFDDHHLVLVYSRPRNFEHFLDMLLYSYRPVRNLSYAVDFILWGERPFGFHLTNLLIHAANTVLAFFLARRLTGKVLLAFVAALIFAVHPIQTEAVSYISGRRDILFTLFYIAGFYSYLVYRSGRSFAYFVLFLVCWALSLMSKEMAVSLPLLIFVWNFCDSWEHQEGSWLKQSASAARTALSRDKWLYAALALAACAYVWYSIYLQNASGRAVDGQLNYWGGSFLSNLFTSICIQAWYLKQLVYPTPIAQYFGAFDIATSLLELQVMLSLAMVGSVIVAGFVLLKKDKLMAFAILSYFALLSPVSQIIPHHELLADHYLYLPMMSFGLFSALVVNKVASSGKLARQFAYGAVTVFIIALAVMTVLRNRDWKDDFTLWRANYEAVPNSPRASYNLGGMYLQRDPKKAEELFRESLADDPNFELTYQALARLLVGQKRLAEAEEIIQKGLALNDSNVGSYVTRNPHLLRSQLLTMLAAAKWEAGDAEKSEQFLRQAMDIYAPNPEPHVSLANMYRGKDRAKELEILMGALAVNPSTYEVNARVVMLLIEYKRFDEALTYLNKMLELAPTEGDCKSGRLYLSAARSAASNFMDQSAIREALESLYQRCGS